MSDNLPFPVNLAGVCLFGLYHFLSLVYDSNPFLGLYSPACVSAMHFQQRGCFRRRHIPGGLA
ncbi:hypothetical protein EJ04DRAFT_118226 [Polyplosphaeria fusca]|uniref:Uncharacterized protein n=1 Tax=Polyplosphaeria fusca TaxID=682080 RepID=A0A9P4R602_9PLEO|nr:hypothetical protein EJ04DRAFT_118226 [Polyplosphaeria fusca]